MTRGNRAHVALAGSRRGALGRLVIAIAAVAAVMAGGLVSTQQASADSGSGISLSSVVVSRQASGDLSVSAQVSASGYMDAETNSCFDRSSYCVIALQSRNKEDGSTSDIDSRSLSRDGADSWTWTVSKTSATIDAIRAILRSVSNDVPDRSSEGSVAVSCDVQVGHLSAGAGRVRIRHRLP